MIKIASCQYGLEVLSHWDHYTQKIEALVIEAKQQNAQLLLLPEYAGVEMICMRHATDQDLFAAMQPLIPRVIEFYLELAHRYQIYIQAGTLVEAIKPNQYVNRAYFFGPNHTYGYQDKLQLIEFEKNLQVMQPGAQQTLFNTALGKVGIAICYDSEFPEIVRNLVYAGAELILVPSYTSSLAGYHRVFLSCRARAIENQCYVAVSFVVGTVALSGDKEETFGQACMLGPADVGFPDDGIIAQGKMNAVTTVFADLSTKKITSVRNHGQVHNFKDAQNFIALNSPQLLSL